MSTITRELAKLFRKITNSEIDAEGNAHVVLSPADSLLINNARIALASLEAEPVCVIDQSNLDYLKSGSDADVWPASRTEMGDVLLYRAAPPAPVVSGEYGDAYQGAREDLAIWKRRALEAEKEVQRLSDINDYLVKEAQGETRMGEPVIREPAPVSVPAAMEMDDDFDSAFEHGKAVGWNAYRAAMLQAEPVTMAYRLPEETGSLLQLRNIIRQRHAEWSQATFGDVGPVGPLKHLSKEALEAAAEPEDLSEWADMQFLLWDAQRRAGISDAEITAAMEDKLKINMERQWPEPKDGEPRLHIKEPGNSPVTPDGWIPVSERMPEPYEYVLVTDGFDGCEVMRVNTDGYWGPAKSLYPGGITHWMPLPEPPQEVNRG